MKKILCMLLVAGMVTTAMAVPAMRDAIVMTAPDGTEKVVYLNGDESFHFMTDEEGNWLDEKTLQPLSEEVKAARSKAGAARVQARRVEQAKKKSLLAPHGAVILVNFADQSFRPVNSLEAMKEWAMGENYTYNHATGSIHQYFMDQSWGQFDLQLDVIGPVTISKSYAYYGKDIGSGSNRTDQHPEDMIVEACQIAHDSLGVDFSQYDSNNDGKVDWVVVIYAGKGQADTGTGDLIWPHQYDLHNNGKTIVLDGKTVDHYCCLNEIKANGTRCGIGTFCHEFSHIMGLPDLYATNDANHKTMGAWDIMDYGPYNNDGNTPPAYSGYERWFFGWINPTLLNKASSVTLPTLCTSKAACYITSTGNSITNVRVPGSNAFYILENRQPFGWDQYLPGHGLLVTKIKYNNTNWSYNQVNNTKANMGVDLIEADGLSPDKSQGKAGDAYPAGSTSFTTVTNYQITNIAEAGNVITFDVNGGGSKITLDIDQLAEEGTAAQKILHDGQVLIIRGGMVYDLNGRRIQ